MIYKAEINFSTKGDCDTVDLTSSVQDHVARSGIQDGVATLFAVGSTAALTTIEFEPGAVRDLRQLAEELIPAAHSYAHNATWGDGNGHSHLRAALFGPSLSIPIDAGRPVTGTWQQIVFVDFDVRPRDRRVRMIVQGD